jgi:hypothetical protein
MLLKVERDNCPMFKCKKKCSDDFVDGIALLVIIAVVVATISYFLLNI